MHASSSWGAGARLEFSPEVPRDLPRSSYLCISSHLFWQGGLVIGFDGPRNRRPLGWSGRLRTKSVAKRFCCLSSLSPYRLHRHDLRLLHERAANETGGNRTVRDTDELCKNTVCSDWPTVSFCRLGVLLDGYSQDVVGSTWSRTTSIGQLPK